MFPPPHRILFECLNDRSTRELWNAAVQENKHRCDFEEVDAAEKNSIDDFAPWLTEWMSFAGQHRIRVLIVWHAHFLSAACQQVLRRSLEQRSFKCRIWFHIEEPILQPAIVSRCVVTVLPRYLHVPVVVGKLDCALYDDPLSYEKSLNTNEGLH